MCNACFFMNYIYVFFIENENHILKLSDLISETDKMRKEREKIKKEKEKLVSGGDLQSGMMWNIGNSLPCPVKNSLPVPVPTRSSGASSNPEPPEASSSSSNSKKERKEIVMKVKQSAKGCFTFQT